MNRDQINWRNYEERSAFENELKYYRKARKERSIVEKLQWVFGIFIVQFGAIVSLYGTCAYFMVAMAKDKKEEEERILLEK